MCRACTTENKTYECEACSSTKRKGEFDHNILRHFLQHRRRLVCKDCQSEGCTPRDTKRYTCKNGCVGGHKNFNSDNLDKHKKRGHALKCKACQEKERAQEEADNEREKRIRKALNSKDAWKCTCRVPIHKEKCDLFPSKFGERRWRGKNKGVTEDDLAFLDSRAGR